MTNEELAIHYQETGSDEVLNQLYQQTSRWIYKYALRYSTQLPEYKDDFIQAAYLGWRRAASKYRMDKGATFLTYATIWMRTFMHKERWRTTGIYIPANLRTDRLFKKLSNYDTLDDNQDYPGWSNTDTDSGARNRRYHARVSCGYAIYGEAYPGLDVEAEYHHQERLAQVKHIFNTTTLDERSSEVIQYRYMYGEECTLEEVGTVFGVTRERVRQIEAKAVRTFRDAARRMESECYSAQVRSAWDRKVNSKYCTVGEATIRRRRAIGRSIRQGNGRPNGMWGEGYPFWKPSTEKRASRRRFLNLLCFRKEQLRLEQALNWYTKQRK